MTKVYSQDLEPVGAGSPLRQSPPHAESTIADRTARLTRYLGSQRPIPLTVIQVHDQRQAQRRIEAAWTSGAAGVFLAGHTIGHQRLLRIARALVAQHPHRFIGVCCPDLRAQDLFCRLPPGIHGIWTTSSGFWPPDADTIAAIRRARHESGWDGLHFVEINLTPFEPSTVPTNRQSLAALRAATIDVDLAILGGQLDRTAPHLSAPQPPTNSSEAAAITQPAPASATLALDAALSALGNPPLGVLHQEVTEPLARLQRSIACIVTWES